MSQHTKLLNQIQAVQVLGIELPELEMYENAGYLRRVIREEGVFYYQYDVTRLMELRDSDRLPRLSPESILMMWTEIQSVRDHVNLLLRMLGIGHPALVIDSIQLANLYDKAVSVLTQEEYKRSELEEWASLFLRLRLGHLTALTTVSNNDRPWEMLYRLANRLCLYLADDPATERNAHLRTLMIQLESGRTHLQNLWATAARLDPARDYRTRLLRMVPDLEDIVQAAAEQQGMSSVPPMMNHLLAESGLLPK